MHANGEKSVYMHVHPHGYKHDRFFNAQGSFSWEPYSGCALMADDHGVHLASPETVAQTRHSMTYMIRVASRMAFRS